MYKSVPVNSNCLFCYTSRHCKTGQVSEKNSDFEEDLLRMLSLETGWLFIHFQKLMMYTLSDVFGLDANHCSQMLSQFRYSQFFPNCYVKKPQFLRQKPRTIMSFSPSPTHIYSVLLHSNKTRPPEH